MPPKASKADLAKKQKVVEDKTFGLKNKNKSKNVQKYVQNLKQSVQPKVDPTKAKVRFSLFLIRILAYVCYFSPIGLYLVRQKLAKIMKIDYSYWKIAFGCSFVKLGFFIFLMGFAEKEGGRESQREGA